MSSQEDEERGELILFRYAVRERVGVPIVERAEGICSLFFWGAFCLDEITAADWRAVFGLFLDVVDEEVEATAAA